MIFTRRTRISSLWKCVLRKIMFYLFIFMKKNSCFLKSSVVTPSLSRISFSIPSAGETPPPEHLCEGAGAQKIEDDPVGRRQRCIQKQESNSGPKTALKLKF
ncbi:hypothetical protein OIU77_011860 [Salix suchowensis]|uniref:Uncharacterized protein n=1 Tax=Salix suchowensis TaxID=1278906 RepID=A0ABQ9A2D2_9ROSI|nr:hypothetical protein OIU77_011860 [Salix suchowensis]